MLFSKLTNFDAHDRSYKERGIPECAKVLLKVAKAVFQEAGLVKPRKQVDTVDPSDQGIKLVGAREKASQRSS